MRIAFISEHASPLAAVGGVDSGGQNIYVLHVARQLARMGQSVDVITRRDRPGLPSVVPLEQNVRVIHVSGGPERYVPKERLLPYMEEFSERTVQWCAAQAVPYRLAHANFFMSGMAALALKRALNLPFVITFHALGRIRRLHQRDADSFPLDRLRIEDELVRHADRVIAECPQDRSDLVQHYAAQLDRVSVVPCGFDAAEFSPGPRTARRTLGIGDDEFVVLQLGRLVPRKGIDNVVRGIAALKRRGVRSRLLIVGGNSDCADERLTPEIGRLRGIAREEGVADQIVFTGQRPRSALRELYCASDVFVTTPWYEPFGITPIEAMACGVPVIGSAVGGIKYSVRDGYSGYLVPPNDPVALADCLGRLHGNPLLARALGRRGLERARQHFTWQRVARDLFREYCRIVGSEQAVPPRAEALS